MKSMEEMYKTGDKVSRAGKYRCAVCGFVIEYLSKHLEYGVTFPVCSVCKSGSDEGSKKADEEFWEYLGE